MLRALKARIRELETEVTADLLPTLEDGDTKAARLDDGSLLGKVSRAQGRQTPAVVDEAALLAWVRRTHPTEIAESVRPAYRDQLLASAKRHGQAVDETTGELVPGVELRTGNPYLSFRSQPGYEQAILDYLSTVDLRHLLESNEEVQP